MTQHAQLSRAILALADRARLGEPTDLTALARELDCSREHAQRTFRAAVGVSPKRFCQHLQAGAATRLLQAGLPVLATALEAGLSGPGRLHDLMTGVHAMTPGEVARGGAGLRLATCTLATPWGRMRVARSERGVCHLAFVDEGDGLAELAASWPAAERVEDARAGAGLAEALAGGRIPPLALVGTNLQLAVWRALLTIPPGATTSYGQLAAALGRPASHARAIGGAVAANPVAVLIPCHRVVRASGALSGYRWGPARKRALLAWEAARAEG